MRAGCATRFFHREMHTNIFHTIVALRNDSLARCIVHESHFVVAGAKTHDAILRCVHLFLDAIATCILCKMREGLEAISRRAFDRKSISPCAHFFPREILFFSVVVIQRNAQMIVRGSKSQMILRDG